MDITKAFIKAKQPCADGFRWYVRNAHEDSSYQELLDALVAAGRVQDACWLLTQFGPTDATLDLDELGADDFVFAGTVRVRRGIEITSTLRVGRSLHADGGIRVGGSLHAGADVHSGGAVTIGADLVTPGALQAAWSVSVQGSLHCETLRAGWEVHCEGDARMDGQTRIGGELRTGGALRCRKQLQVGAGLDCGATLQAGQGVEAEGDVRAAMHLLAGWGIRARGDIAAGGAIRVGESLWADGYITAGDGYGVYAGMDVRVDAWESSASVRARRRPEGLRSGWWAGAPPGCQEEEDACAGDSHAA